MPSPHTWPDITEAATTLICSMVSMVSLAASSSRGRMISSSSCILATSSEVRSSWSGGHKEELDVTGT